MKDRKRKGLKKTHNSSLFRNFLVFVMVLGVMFLLFSFYQARSGSFDYNKVENMSPTSKIEKPHSTSPPTNSKPEISRATTPAPQNDRKIYAMSYTTKDHFSAAEYSCKIHDVTYKLDYRKVEYKSHSQKLKAVREYVLHLLKPKNKGGEGAKPDDLLLYLDHLDTFVVCNEEEIVKAFTSLGKMIVVEGEAGCWPDKAACVLYDKYFPEAPTRFRYVNSGVYIGTLEALKFMFEDIDEEFDGIDNCCNLNPGNGEPVFVGDNREFQDQRCLTNYLMKKAKVDNDKDFIGIDYEGIITSSMHTQRVDDYEWKGFNYVFNNNLKKRTCILHGNGAAEDSVDTAFHLVFDVEKWLHQRNVKQKQGAIGRLRKRDKTKVYREKN